jgi:geranylgeranyl diphosphate synthase type II
VRVGAEASLRLRELAALVERALDAVLPSACRPDREAPDRFGQARLLEAMRYSLQTPGKRLRPLLLLASAQAVGADPLPLVRFACGVELIHAYSLVHDDLPAMDDDDLRRGQPTNHVVYGEGMAILAGDGLLAQAAVVMLEPTCDPAVQLEVTRDIMAAAAFAGMVGGQAADLLAEGIEPDLAVLAGIHRRKTGALIAAAARGGAALGGADARQLGVLGRFADRFGLAFQIADDIKDEIAPSEVTGKRPGGDREAGKLTYPSLVGIDGALEICRTELDAAIAELAPLGDRATILETLARECVAPAFRT